MFRALLFLLPPAALCVRPGMWVRTEARHVTGARPVSPTAPCTRQVLLRSAAAAATVCACRAAYALTDVGDDYTTSRGLEMKAVTPTFEKLPSGVRFVDLKAGTGETCKEGSRVSLQVDTSHS